MVKTLFYFAGKLIIVLLTLVLYSGSANSKKDRRVLRAPFLAELRVFSVQGRTSGCSKLAEAEQVSLDFGTVWDFFSGAVEIPWRFWRGRVRYDRGNRRRSITTASSAAFLKWIEKPGLEINQIIHQIREDVVTVMRGKQVPWQLRHRS